MKTRILALLPLVLCLCFAAVHSAHAQTTAFTYQGRLNDGGNPANGAYDLTFTLFDAASGGATVGASNVVNDLGVTNGLFTVPLDFGSAAFDGSDRWLEVAVRPGASSGSYSNLVPRQPITSTPYAVRAGNFSGTVASSQISGVIPLAQLPVAVVTNGASGVNFTGTFAGDGAGVTNVSVGSLRQPVPPVVAWGHGFYGQTTVPAGLSSVMAIAGGGNHNLALKSDGTVVAWGYNANGQTNVPAGLSNVMAIAGGFAHSLALKSEGTVVAWGIMPAAKPTSPPA